LDGIIRENADKWQSLSDAEVDEVLQASYRRLKGPGEQ
jgi:hypothetical protein